MIKLSVRALWTIAILGAAAAVIAASLRAVIQMPSVLDIGLLAITSLGIIAFFTGAGGAVATSRNGDRNR